MGRVVYVRQLFLRFMCLIYLFAFTSFYLQIPGLYGNNGILPARTHLADSGGRTLSEKIHNKQTLLWFAPYLGLNTEYMMDVLALLGIILSLTGFVSSDFSTAPVFAALWSLYYSLYQVGQTFMWFQWDILLLEAGFIAILNAKTMIPIVSKLYKHSPQSDNITLFLVKWLLFRLMFASGVVKLLSGCPTWWGLTALEVHFESQPLPTPLAWYAHHLPRWFLKLGTVYTHIVEQIMPFLFFFPLRSVRITGFFFQLALQLAIILTGNYNFFNLLTICLCISLLDDEFFYPVKRNKGFREDYKKYLLSFLKMCANIAVHGFIVYIAVVYYSLRINPNWTIESSIAFTKDEFDTFLKRAVPASIYVGGVTLIWLSLSAIVNCFKLKNNKIKSLLVTLIYISLAFFMFGISLVPHSSLHKSANETIVPPLRKLHAKIGHLEIANSYGLFRRMTGVGGRPEVVIEGSDDVAGPWHEYHFRYKPTDVNSSLTFLAPHQPRLDWQMWFAALSTYHQNPWIMSVAYRILEGDKNVMHLMGPQRLPFDKPPKYLKASLYHYHFTPWSQRNGKATWRREKKGEYFPIFTKSHAPLVDYLKSLKILDTRENTIADEKTVLPWLKVGLDALRNTVGRLDPCLAILSVFMAACAIILTPAMFSSGSSSKSNQRKSGYAR